MDIILVPGLWLDARSWDPILPALTAAGHRPHPLTMPGVGASAEDSADIGMSDWVAAVVERIDELTGDVVLVGHSGGGNVVWGAADARPDRVARVVFVDTAPPAPGYAISEFPVVDGVVPFPGWEFFESEETDDLSPGIRSGTAGLLSPIPARVPTDPIVLEDPRRFTVPVTLLMGSFDAEAIEALMAEWPDAAAEYQSIENRDVVRIGSGHWPQFSVPERLGELLVNAVR